MSIILAIIVLGIIIFVHEGGHFLFAKLFNVPVREFSIGMGKRLFSFNKGKTKYSLKLFPIGGSCALIGEDPAGSGDMTEVDGEIDLEKNTIKFDDIEYDLDYIKNNNYSAISPIKKILICVGGPLFNFILAILLSIVLVSFTGIDLPIIDSLNENSPALKADPIALQTGDRILSIELPNNNKKNVVLTRDLTLFMALNGEDIVKYDLPIKISFIRQNKKYETCIIPQYDSNYQRPMIGISLKPQQKIDNIIDLVKYGYSEFAFYIDSTIISLRMLFNGRLKMTDVSGPVGTVAIMSTSIKEAGKIDILSGILTMISLTVLISANLGVMNLLPIPALDGGRIVFATIELIIGKKLNPKVESFCNIFTMILLLVFMAWIFGLDIFKLIMK